MSNVGTAKEPVPNPIPRALQANTKEDVQKMFGSSYFKFPDTPFWDGVSIQDVKKGTHRLWKNVPTGKRGGESTKTEFFHGHCHGWEGGECTIS